MSEPVDISKDKNFSKYGAKFQLATLKLLYKEEPFGIRVKDMLKPEYFDNKFYQQLCELIVGYYNEHKTRPSYDTLKTVIETRGGVGTKVFLTTLDTVEEVDLAERSFTIAEVEKFCFTKKALADLEQQKTHIEMGHFDSAKEIAYKMYSPVNKVSNDFDLKQDFREVLESKIHTPVPTIFPSFNKLSQGGPGAGDLCLVIASSNFGKTAMLTAQARHAAEQGFNVLYFSLETKNAQIAQRAIAGLVGLNQEVIREHPGLIEKRIEGLKGNIKFVQFKATEARIEVLRSKVEECKATGYFPDIILVDSLNQLKSPYTAKFFSNNDKFEYLSEELRDLAGELALPIYTTLQTNRSGFGSEINDEQSIGKAIEPYQVADWAIVFSQPIALFDRGECYVTLLKNRLGPKGLTLLLKYDPNQGTVVELETIQRSMLYDKKLKNDMSNGISIAKKKIEELKGASRPMS